MVQSPGVPDGSLHHAWRNRVPVDRQNVTLPEALRSEAKVGSAQLHAVPVDFHGAWYRASWIAHEGHELPQPLILEAVRLKKLEAQRRPAEQFHTHLVLRRDLRLTVGAKVAQVRQQRQAGASRLERKSPKCMMRGTRPKAPDSLSQSCSATSQRFRRPWKLREPHGR